MRFDPTTAQRPVRITQHARRRMHEQRVDVSAVLLALSAPDVDYAQPEHGETARMAQRGPIAVAYYSDARNVRIVKSVYWRTNVQYARGPAFALVTYPTIRKVRP